MIVSAETLHLYFFCAVYRQLTSSEVQRLLSARCEGFRAPLPLHAVLGRAESDGGQRRRRGRGAEGDWTSTPLPATDAADSHKARLQAAMQALRERACTSAAGGSSAACANASLDASPVANASRRGASGAAAERAALPRLLVTGVPGTVEAPWGLDAAGALAGRGVLARRPGPGGAVKE